MGAKRKRHTEEFKAKVALEAIRGVRTLSELSATHGVHSAVIGQWKRQLVEGAAELFRRGEGAVGGCGGGARGGVRGGVGGGGGGGWGGEGGVCSCGEKGAGGKKGLSLGGRRII